MSVVVGWGQLSQGSANAWSLFLGCACWGLFPQLFAGDIQISALVRLGTSSGTLHQLANVSNRLQLNYKKIRVPVVYSNLSPNTGLMIGSFIKQSSAVRALYAQSRAADCTVVRRLHTVRSKISVPVFHSVVVALVPGRRAVWYPSQLHTASSVGPEIVMYD